VAGLASKTGTPGMNMRDAGLGVDCVWMKMPRLAPPPNAEEAGARRAAAPAVFAVASPPEAAKLGIPPRAPREENAAENPRYTPGAEAALAVDGGAEARAAAAASWRRLRRMANIVAS
jgi:hypothetical protein